MDIRHRTLGLRQQNQHCHNTESPNQNTPIHHERTMVCIQPHFTQKSKNSLRYRNYQRKQHQVLQQTRKSLQPTSLTSTTTSTKIAHSKEIGQQTLKELRKTSLNVYPIHVTNSVQLIVVNLYTNQHIDLYMVQSDCQ
jgi:hypothetical protein